MTAYIVPALAAVVVTRGRALVAVMSVTVAALSVGMVTPPPGQ
jgi:hypothetical protein